MHPHTSSTPCRVMLVEDDVITRRLLCNAIELEPALELCAAVASVADALRTMETSHFDVLLTDLGLPFCTLPLQNDADVKSFWQKWAGGSDIISQQAASAQKKDVVAPWFGEWNETSNQAWQSVFLARATPEAATAAMARKWAELKKG